jgi:hypothetical protein
MEPEPIPTMGQVEPDVRLDDDGRPFVDPDPKEPDDVPEEELR